jgi:hypothetical protein
VPIRAREFLTFFDDGTFLWGLNHPPSAQTTCPNPFTVTGGTQFPNCTPATPVRNPGESGPTSAAANGNFAAASGVNHGFYSYDPVAKTIAFVVTNASNIFPTYQGLNGAPGYTLLPAGSTMATSVRGQVTANNVTKTAADPLTDTPGKISISFGPGARQLQRPQTTGNTVVSAHLGSAQTQTWNMTEPVSIPGEIAGAWSTPDHTRVFVYDKSTFYGFHMGINGLPTLQDACFLVSDLSTQMEGQLIRHGSTGTCVPGAAVLANSDANRIAAYRDVPYFQGTQKTMPKLPSGYHGAFPGSQASLDGRPASPSNFVVAPDDYDPSPSDPNVLKVQATSNGVPLADQPPIYWTREAANAPALVP